MPEKKITFPPGQHFTCTECGKCCSFPWRVKVAPQKAALICQLKAYQSRRRESFEPLQLVDEGFEMNRKSDGSCTFQVETRCSIHQEGGLAAKPSVCQLYPFTLVATPDGYFVTLAFTCPAVISGSGEPAYLQEKNLKRTIVQAPHYFPPDANSTDKITLVEGFGVSWEDYLQLENQILAQLSQASSPVVFLLQTVAFIAQCARDQLALSPLQASLLEREATEILPVFVARSIALLEKENPSGERAPLAREVLDGGRPYSNLLEAPLDCGRSGEVPDQIVGEVVKRYITNKIWGKGLATGPSLLQRFFFLAISVEIFLNYYESRKKSLGRLHFSLEDAEWCFHLIEKELPQHSDFLWPLLSQWEKTVMEA